MTDAALQLRFGSATLATGPELHYAEQGEPDGAPVVLLHGWPDSWFSFSRVLPLLPDRFHAFAPDQRGFGDSDRTARSYAIDDLATDVVAFMDTVGLEHAALVGHSMGTFVARRAAELHPERVSRLVLIGAAMTARNDVLEEVRANVEDLADPVPVEFAREFQAGTVHVPLPDDFFEGIVGESRKLPAHLWRELLEGVIAFDDVDELPAITAPTLIVWGDHDALFPREQQERLLAAIPGAQLTIYPETGHCPNWERPEKVANDLDAFLPGP